MVVASVGRSGWEKFPDEACPAHQPILEVSVVKWGVWQVSRSMWMGTESWGRKHRAVIHRETLIDDGHSAADLEVRRVLPVLEEHGTTLMVLKPGLIWQAAMDDLANRERNRGGSIGSIKHYSFHRRHVLKAESANDILRAAIADPALGRSSGKRMTRLLYSDVEQLKAALK